MQKSKLLFALFSIICFFTFVGLAFSAEYYVDNVHPKASDENPGSSEKPLKTISRAVAKAYAGDKVLISSGTYRELIEFVHNGSDETHPITLCGLPGADVKIKGSDSVTGWVLHSASIWKRSGWTVNSQQVFVDGAPLQQIGAKSPFCKQVIYDGKPNLSCVGTGLSDMFPGAFTYDEDTKTLFVWLKDGSDPNKHQMEASVRNCIIPPGRPANFIKLDNLTFSHSNQTANGGTNGIVNVYGRSWIISNCNFTYGDFSGLHITGENHKITNNAANYNGNTGMCINGSDAAHNWRRYPERPPQQILLESNDTSYNNYRGFYKAWHAGGIKIIPSCNEVVIRKHTANSNSKAPGIWVDGWCSNITIDSCKVTGNTVGIFYEISEKGYIINNVVLDNSEQGIYVSASDKVMVLNNTVVSNWAGIVAHGLPRKERPFLRGNMIFNNIIANSKAVDLVIYSNPNNGEDNHNNQSDYNLYSHSTGSLKISIAHDKGYPINYKDLHVLSAATKLEAHSLEGDPLWENPSQGDYSLRKGSLAIDRGIADIPKLPDHDHLEGKRLVNGKVSIGAYEFKGNHISAPPPNSSQR